MAKRGAAVLEMPGPEYAPENGSRRHAGSGPQPGAASRLRRDPVEDFADEYNTPTEPERGRRAPVRRPAVKLKLAGRLMPTSMAGIIATGIALLLLLGGVLWLLAVTRTFLLHDARFRLAGPSAIEIEGNHHLTRPQLLALFADDLDRNVFGVSLDQRRADLEAMPWVRHATLMRLLPGRLRVSLVERTPVAFVRQGSHIGLVDADGVLLDMPSGSQTGSQAEHFSFPVVTGIVAADPPSTRAARMKILARFMAELDADGTKNSESLSEVDLANPEDVKALVEEHGATVLVHFGEDQFLERFRKVKELLPQWHAQYPNLASADLRYEHEIPLAMAKPVPATSAAAKPLALTKSVAPVKPAPQALVAARPTPARTPHTDPAIHPITHPPAHPALKVAPAAHPPAKIAAAPAHPVEHSFVPAPTIKPWQPAPAASQSAATPSANTPSANAASVSAAARSSFASRQTPSPAPKAPARAAPTTIARATPPHPAPAAHAAAAAPTPLKHAAGKPSAGKPLLSPDPHPTPQAAQR